MTSNDSHRHRAIWRETNSSRRAGYHVHMIDPEGYWQYEEHPHLDVCELVVVLHGHLTQVLNGQSTVQTAGQIVLLRDGDRHALSGRHFAYVNLMFPPAWLRRLEAYTQLRGLQDQLLSDPDVPSAIIPPEERPEYFEQVDALRFNQRHDYGRQLFAQFLLLTVTRYLAPVIKANIPDGTPDWLAHTVSWIHLHNEALPTLAEAVVHSCRCQEHFTREFKRWLGTTPTRYLSHLRIDRAAELLSTTSYTVQEICAMTGFENASYFYRLFAREKGTSPLSWRRQYGPRSIQTR